MRPNNYREELAILDSQRRRSVRINRVIAIVFAVVGLGFMLCGGWFLGVPAVAIGVFMWLSTALVNRRLVALIDDAYRRCREMEELAGEKARAGE